MPVDLEHALDAVQLAARTRAFIRDVVIPVEDSCGGVLAGDEGERTRRKLQEAARDAGVFAPHAAVEYGGHGLDMRSRALVFEEAGYSLLGPIALNIAAPDEANIHMLERIATPEQKERYLAPLAAGAVRSCMAMTEPVPGAGSDPAALSTTATKVSGGWQLNGRKWFATGAAGAAFTIVFARTSGEPGQLGGATMFLVDAGNPGQKLARPHIETLDQSLYGGHAEVHYEDCFVPDEAVLGEADRGYEYAQVRLDPARTTHCMRWLGIARRSSDIALAYANERQLFGSRLADLGMAQQIIADNEIDIAASRALVLQACWELDRGRPAAQSVSVAKTFVSEAVGRVVDRSLQLCGSLGVSCDLLLSRYLREVRAFRIYDGPSETHRWAIAKRAAKHARTSRDG